jgi:hypothetical protein
MNLDYWISHAMITQGGSFVAALGHAYIKADPDNKQKLRTAFPDIFDKYTTIATELKQQDDLKP